MSERSALGKGLASLLPGSKPTPSGVLVQNTIREENENNGPVVTGNADRIPGISLADVDSIIPNPNQPRREFDPKELAELSNSIKENGIIQPLVVRKLESGYELIAGERRLRASKMAGIKQVPIVIRKSTDKESLELALIENIQRANLNCVDEALGYFQLMEEFKLTQEQIAKQVGKERSTVTNALRLLRLQDAILVDLKKGILSRGHGKAIASIEDPELRMKAFEKIKEKDLSVRETETLVAQLKGELKKENPKTKEDLKSSGLDTPMALRFRKLSEEMTHTVGAKVKLTGTEKKGKIVISYGSRSDLDRILSKMQNKDLWQEKQI